MCINGLAEMLLSRPYGERDGKSFRMDIMSAMARGGITRCEKWKWPEGIVDDSYSFAFRMKTMLSFENCSLLAALSPSQELVRRNEWWCRNGHRIPMLRCVLSILHRQSRPTELTVNNDTQGCELLSLLCWKSRDRSVSIRKESLRFSQWIYSNKSNDSRSICKSSRRWRYLSQSEAVV